MNLSEIQQRVAAIRAAATGDPEAAHSMEDALHRDALAAIEQMGIDNYVNIALDAPALAGAVLVSTQIEFPRHMS